MDQRVLLVSNITAFDGDVAMVTQTAPGADVLPWADAERTTVQAEARYRWNRDAPDRWTRLHRAAAQAVRRRFGPWEPLAQEWEYQSRGVLHRHIIVPMSTAREIAAAHFYVQELDRRRAAHGFGFVDRGRRSRGGRRLPIMRAGEAAAYLAKYLAKADDTGRLVLTETVKREDVPGRVTYVSRKLTGQTRVTMRTLRLRRQAHVLARVHAAPFTDVLGWLLGESPTVQLLMGQRLAEPQGP